MPRGPQTNLEDVENDLEIDDIDDDEGNSPVASLLPTARRARRSQDAGGGFGAEGEARED